MTGSFVQVDLWCTDLAYSCDLALHRSLTELLSADERVRLAAFSRVGPRHTQLMARALVRTVLSSYESIAPEAWVFIADPKGKPRAITPGGRSGPCFNISHSQGLLVCAVRGDGPLGVDVEPVDREVQVDELVACLTVDERRDLQSCEPKRWRERFFQYWTLKEAYAKATGEGLRLPFSQLGFRLDRGHPELCAVPAAMPMRGVVMRQERRVRHWVSVSLLAVPEQSQLQLSYYQGTPLCGFRSWSAEDATWASP